MSYLSMENSKCTFKCYKGKVFDFSIEPYFYQKIFLLIHEEIEMQWLLYDR